MNEEDIGLHAFDPRFGHTRSTSGLLTQIAASREWLRQRASPKARVRLDRRRVDSWVPKTGNVDGT